MQRLWSCATDAPGGARVHLALDAYRLNLRSAFGTSHSSTTTRTNALLRLSISDSNAPDAPPLASGVGEAGLPPKKFGCYESDLDDICAFFRAFEAHLAHLAHVPPRAACPLAACPPQFFASMRVSTATTASSDANITSPPASLVVNALRALLGALDTFPTAQFGQSYKAAHCAFELAVFDAWGGAISMPIHEMIAPHAPSSASSSSSSTSSPDTSTIVGRSFYTIGLDTPDQMCHTCTFGLQHTPLLKIKLDADCARAAEILQRVHEVCVASGAEFTWSIDANAAWSTPALAIAFLDVLRPYSAHIFMCEQPFGLFRARPDAHSTLSVSTNTPALVSRVANGRLVDFVSSAAECAAVAATHGVDSDAHLVARAELDEWSAWCDVKRAYGDAGILVFADESICSASDVAALASLVHGVNVKLEKCAGLRGAVRAIDAARAHELRVWIGTMVGSQLNSTGAAHLLPLACYGDMDGALLTTPESQAFGGGMQWCDARTGAIRMAHGVGGLGCVALPEYGSSA